MNFERAAADRHDVEVVLPEQQVVFQRGERIMHQFSHGSGRLGWAGGSAERPRRRAGEEFSQQESGGRTEGQTQGDSPERGLGGGRRAAAS